MKKFRLALLLIIPLGVLLLYMAGYHQVVHRQKVHDIAWWLSGGNPASPIHRRTLEYAGLFYSPVLQWDDARTLSQRRAQLTGRWTSATGSAVELTVDATGHTHVRLPGHDFHAQLETNGTHLRLVAAEELWDTRLQGQSQDQTLMLYLLHSEEAGSTLRVRIHTTPTAGGDVRTLYTDLHLQRQTERES